jgi:hypothetical protein
LVASADVANEADADAAKAALVVYEQSALMGLYKVQVMLVQVLR